MPTLRVVLKIKNNVRKSPGPSSMGKLIKELVLCDYHVMRTCTLMRREDREHLEEVSELSTRIGIRK